MKTTKTKTYIMITDVICELGELQEKLERIRNDLWDSMSKKQHIKAYERASWELIEKEWAIMKKIGDEQNEKEKI